MLPATVPTDAVAHRVYDPVFAAAAPRLKRVVRITRIAHVALLVVQSVGTSVAAFLHVHDDKGDALFGMDHDTSKHVGLVFGLVSLLTTAVLANVPLEAAHATASESLRIVQEYRLSRKPLPPEVVEKVVRVEGLACWRKPIVDV